MRPFKASLCLVRLSLWSTRKECSCLLLPVSCFLFLASCFLSRLTIGSHQKWLRGGFGRSCCSFFLLPSPHIWPWLSTASSLSLLAVTPQLGLSSRCFLSFVGSQTPPWLDAYLLHGILFSYLHRTFPGGIVTLQE